MRLRYVLFPAIAFCTALASLAQGPFDGTWALNQSKSHLTGDTIRLQAAGNGMMTYTDSEQSYTFKPDGTPFQTKTGSERMFKKIDDRNFEMTVKRNGMLLFTSTWKLSDNGKTLNIERKGIRPNGDSFDNQSTYTRTSAGNGLIGSWKSTDVKLSTPATLTIASDGKNGVTINISAEKATCEAKWDGKDYPATGPTVPDGLTLALTKTGAHSFKIVDKLQGKVINIEYYRVSADGKTLTCHGTDGQGKEPYTEVMEKQA